MTEPTRPVSIEDLLAHSEWVRRLAYSLARNADDAQDLVQEAWVTAIAHPPKHGANLKGWFRKLVRNRWLDLRQSQAAREERERSASRSEVSPDTTELVRRADATSLLAGFVVAEAEPYRTVLLMRYFDDLPPATIAERLGVPVNTVNSRLQRGHARLRERLERVRGPEWRVVLLPLLDWQGAPTPVPAPSPPGPRLGRALTATGIGVLAVIAAWLWLLPLLGPGSGVDDGAEVGTLPAGDPAAGQRAAHPARIKAAGDAAAAETTTPPATTDAAAADAASSLDAGRVRVRGRFAEGTNATSVAATLTPYVALPWKNRGTSRPLTLTSPAFDFDVPRRDESGRRIVSWEIEADDPEFLRMVVQARMPLPEEGNDPVDLGEIRLERAGHVTGTVTWEGDEIAGPADVVTVADEAWGGSQFDHAKVELGGRFRLRTLPGKPMFVVAATQRSAPASAPFTSAGGAEVDVGVLQLTKGARVTGRIVCPKLGIPADAALSVIARKPPSPAWVITGHFFAPVDGRAVRYSQDIHPDANGEFVAEGLASIPLRLNLYNVNRFPKDLLTAAQTEVDASSGRAEAVLDGGLIRVLVRGDGGPLKGAIVSLQPDKDWFGALASGTDGIAEFIGIPGAHYTVSAQADGFVGEPQSVTAPPIDAAVDVALDLHSVPRAPNATWNVTFRTDGGTPPKVASFAFFGPGDRFKRPFPKFTRDVEAKDGVFRVPDVTPGTWWVLCQPGSTWLDPTGFFVSEVGERTFQPGAESTESIPASPGGRIVVTGREADGSLSQHLSGQLFDAAHVPVWCVARFFTPSTPGGGTQFSSFGATDLCPALAPGRYKLEVTSVVGTNVATKTVDVDVVAGRVTQVKVKFDAR